MDKLSYNDRLPQLRIVRLQCVNIEDEIDRTGLIEFSEDFKEKKLRSAL